MGTYVILAVMAVVVAEAVHALLVEVVERVVVGVVYIPVHVVVVIHVDEHGVGPTTMTDHNDTEM